MSTQIQRRRGTTAEHSTFTGVEGELTVDTTKDTVVVHDGATTGGRPLLREDQANLPTSVTNGISVPSANNVAISTNGTGRLFVDASGRVLVGTSSALRTTIGRTIQSASTAGAYLALGRDESDPTANSAVASFEGYVKSGSTYAVAGSVAFETDGAVSSGDYPTRLVFSTTSDGASSPTERLRITSAGLVGVGTSTPESYGASADNLVIADNGNAGITIAGGPTSYSSIFFADGTSGAQQYAGYLQYEHTEDKLFIGAGAAPAVTIDSSQRVGLGTSSPSAVLHISSASPTVRISDTSGTASNLTGQILFQEMGTTSAMGRIGYTGGDAILRVKTDGAQPIAFLTNDAERARIDSSGRFLVGTSSASGEPIAAFQGRSNDATDSGIVAITRSGANPSGSIGELRFATGSDLNKYYAMIIAASDGSTSASSLPGMLRFHTTANGATTPTERMRIDSSGRLLVGTSSTSSVTRAVIQGNSAGNSQAIAYFQRGSANPTSSDQLAELKFADSNGSVGAEIAAYTDAAWASNNYPGRLSFSTTASGASSPTERMRIRNNGEVLLGGITSVATYNQGAGFGDLSTTTSYMRIGHNSTGAAYSYIAFGFNTGDIGGITQNSAGTAVAYNTTSDYRLKENIVPLTGAADRLKQLQVHRFNFIADPDTTVDGFLAHEAQAIVPECVTGDKDAVDDEGNPVYQGIDQSKLVPLLTAALQEALAEIESLKARVTALEP